MSSALSRITAGKTDDTHTLSRRSEMIGVIIVGTALLFGFALWTFDPADMDIVHAGRGASAELHNAIGPVGARIADLLLQLMGLGAFALDGLLLFIGVRALMGDDLVPTPRLIAGGLGAALGGLMLTHLAARGLNARPLGHEAAGFVGSATAEFSRAFVSTAGTLLIGLTILLSSISALSGRPLVRLMASALRRKGRSLAGTLRTAAAQHVVDTRTEWAQRRAARAEARAARIEAERVAAEAREAAEREAEAERQSKLEEAQPVAWDPNTGLHHISSKRGSRSSKKAVTDQSAVAIPHTRPSKRQRAAQITEAEAAQGGDFPAGQTIAPAKDLIPPTARAATEIPPAPLEPAPVELADGYVAAVNPTDATRAVEQHDATLVSSSTPTRPSRTNHRRVSINQPAPEVAAPPEQTARPGGIAPVAAAAPVAAVAAAPEAPAVSAPVAAAPVVPPHEAATPVAVAPAPAAPVAAKPQPAHVPRIVETPALREPKPAVVPSEQGALEIGDKKVWKLPPRYLVQLPPNRVVAAPQAVLVDNARVLEQKLEDFKIKGQVTDIRPGPVVTTYEYKPAPGMRISKIVSLKDDLTMSLSALRVRVVAPIPGRDVVGIEVPNRQRQFVYFREVLDSEVYANSKSNLTVILGKDIEGAPVVSDLARAPHMLVAGATGTGKSVGINSFLCSMLYKASPDDVKFIMIDPKVLELCIYEDIPHLLLPPVSEPHHAELALKWAVREMDRRYHILAGAKVRNISGYRAKLPVLRENARKKKMKVVDGKKVLVDANTPGAELLDPPPAPEPMPYIVVVIDEFADLIMASGKEVERSVARLAQKARACGIHVILATQRPSTDVLTGMIKANFPTRVSFQVASSIDSKVVLGAIGAESLLGMGDLLYVPPGTSHLKRCHGTWITDDEVAAIADHWKAQGKPNYDMSILEDPDAEKMTLDEDAKLDTLFEDAVQVALEAQQASVSFLQRKLGIGYGRAARIIDHMEAKGIVGPQRSANKPREILLSSGEAGL